MSNRKKANSINIKPIETIIEEEFKVAIEGLSLILTLKN